MQSRLTAAIQLMARMALDTTINLLRGWPSITLLPHGLLNTASTRTLSSPTLATPALSYPPDEGSETLRRQLSYFLASFYRPAPPPRHSPPASPTPSPSALGPGGLRIDPARLAITGGASQSLAVLLGVATDPSYTRGVWAVEPTYFLACRIFDDAGLRVRGVPDGAGGVDVAALRERLVQAEREREEELRGGVDRPMFKPVTRSWPTHIYKHIIYAVPSFSNPTGRCMTLRCREDLVRLAREFDALVICDDIYDFLWWPVEEDEGRGEQPVNDPASFRAVLPRLVDIDRDLPGTTTFGNVVSNGSFSKICAPGMRTGWVEGTPPLAFAVSQAGSSRSGGAPSGIAATVLGAALAAEDLQRHVETVLRPAYARRWTRMHAAIEEHLVPLGASLPFPHVDVRAVHGGVEPPVGLPSAVAGGYFFWARLPDGIGAAALAARAEERGRVIVQTEASCLVPEVAGTSGAVRGAPGGDNDRHVRLCFAWEEEDRLAEGVERLAAVLRDMLAGDNEPVTGGDRSGPQYS